MQHLDPVLLRSIILLLPLVATGIAFIIDRPDYFQRVGLMLGLLYNIPYLFLLNILAVELGWWVYPPSANTWFHIPVEIVLGWAIFWGVFLPYVFRSTGVFITIGMAALLDLLFMPAATGLFTLNEGWLIGEIMMLLLVLLPSVVIFRLTWQRKYVLVRALIQSVIWGGWIVFFIPAIALQIESKSIFDLFDMKMTRVALFILGMAVSFVIGYLALYEFAKRGEGTPIPFDPPKKLVTTGIYSVVANPLQISTLLIFVCIMFAYASVYMLLPIFVFFLYTELFVRWHHIIDIEERFGRQWLAYKSEVRNWIPVIKG